MTFAGQKLSTDNARQSSRCTVDENMSNEAILEKYAAIQEYIQSSYITLYANNEYLSETGSQNVSELF